MTDMFKLYFQRHTSLCDNVVAFSTKQCINVIYNAYLMFCYIHFKRHVTKNIPQIQCFSFYAVYYSDFHDTDQVHVLTFLKIKNRVQLARDLVVRYVKKQETKNSRYRLTFSYISTQLKPI